MSHPATAEQATSQSSRHRTEAGEHTTVPQSEIRTSQEIEAALSAIPSASVTARTAGALRVPGPRRMIAEERAARRLLALKGDHPDGGGLLVVMVHEEQSPGWHERTPKQRSIVRHRQ